MSELGTGPLRAFSTWARTALITEVSARMAAVLAPGSSVRVEQTAAVTGLERAVSAAGGGRAGRATVAERVAYMWFNRLVALRFMDANGYTGIGVVSPPSGAALGQPEVLAEAKRGVIDSTVVGQRSSALVTALLDGTRPSPDPQGEAYGLLLAEYCRHFHQAMPFMFEAEGDYTESLMPANLLADDSVLNRALRVLTPEVCADVEVIGWMYQFYISERKDEVFAGFKKNKKAGAAEIPAATQLFTPHWIVRYLVENSIGRLWMLNRPDSRLVDQMDYYIPPVDNETDFLKITGPEELTVIDPACGSGHMLTYAFDLLFAMYSEEGYAPSEIPAMILTHNLYGTEIDPRAGSLAAFALTMKARARQRTFLNRGVQPNICVIESITFTDDELASLHTPDVDPDEEDQFWNQFSEASILGALIQPDRHLTTRLSRHLEDMKDGGDLLHADLIQRAHKVMKQAATLSNSYSAVVANPPYMGLRNMDEQLAVALARRFPTFKSDLFSAFVFRVASLAHDHGQCGVMSPNVWMYISSHEGLRHFLLEQSSLETLLELPLSGFKGATVQICAYCFRASAGERQRPAIFFRLVEYQGGDSDYAELTKTAIAKTDGPPIRFVSSPSAFREIPGCPIAYWLREEELDNFKARRLLGAVAEPRKGMDTGDNSEFLRFWWEVSQLRVSREPDDNRKWFSYNKGGGFRRWYGNRHYVVNWENEGSSIRARLHWPSRTPTLRNQSFYFREGFTWGTVSSGRFSARYTPAGALFDNGGCTLFADSNLERLGALMNSSSMDRYLSFLAPTLNFQPGDIAKVPVPPTLEEVEVPTQRCVEIARWDWDCYEDSIDFAGSPLLRGERSTRAATEAHLDECCRKAEELRALEEANNEAWAGAFRLSELATTVDLKGVSLWGNPSFRYGTETNDERARGWASSDAIADFVSYAVGCMFGRYSLDEPGLIVADQGTTLKDFLARIPQPTFIPDADNVIPIVDGDWFEDDIVARFRQFLRAAFGEEHFEENLRFVTESLGVKNIRDYFVRSFYKDHVKRYKKRPIYWLFSSPKGSFNALIYMHRYSPSTVSTVLNEYLREFQAKLTASLDNAERADKVKEADRLRKILVELNEYEHDVLYPLATQNIVIDLDDGVKANYPKFGAALKKIPGLEASE